MPQAAYKFARLGALLVRLLRQFVRVEHGLMEFVDNSLPLLLPSCVAASVNVTAITFSVSLAVLMSDVESE